MGKTLVGVATYESLKQLREFAKRKTEPHDMGMRISDSFKTPLDTRILDWLESNTLVRMTQAMPEHYNSDFTYILQGSNNVLCAIHPKLVNLKGGSVGLFAENHEYLWRVTIRYQPITSELPSELTEALSKLGFNRTE